MALNRIIIAHNWYDIYYEKYHFTLQELFTITTGHMSYHHLYYEFIYNELFLSIPCAVKSALFAYLYYATDVDT